MPWIPNTTIIPYDPGTSSPGVASGIKHAKSPRLRTEVRGCIWPWAKVRMVQTAFLDGR